MANLQKFTRGGVIGLSNHIERKTDNHSNKEIDVTRTHLNYSLVQTDGDMTSRLKKRLDEVYCFNRADVNVLGSWIVTLPKNLKENSEQDQREFFEQSFNFMAQRYGEKNVVAGEVHVDETTPHIHFSFVPVVPDEKKGEKVSAKLLLNRTDLKSFHTDLDRHLKNNLPFYEGGVLTGDTDKIIKDAKVFKEIMKATDIKKVELQQTEKQKSFVQNEKNVAEVELKEIKSKFDQQATANENLKSEMVILSESYNQKLKEKEMLNIEVENIKDKFSDAQLDFDLLNQQLLDLKNRKELLDKELEDYKKEVEKTKIEYLNEKNEYIKNFEKKMKDENATLEKITKEVKAKQDEFKEIDNYLKTSLKSFTEEFLGKDKVNDYQTNIKAINERVRPVKTVFGLKTNYEVKMSVEDYEKLVEYADRAVEFRDNYYLNKNEKEKLIFDNEKISSQSGYNFDRYKNEKAEHDNLKEVFSKWQSSYSKIAFANKEVGAVNRTLKAYILKNNLLEDYKKFELSENELKKNLNKKKDAGLEL